MTEKFNLLPEFCQIQEHARECLAKEIVTKVDKKFGLITIKTKAAMPRRAASLDK